MLCLLAVLIAGMLLADRKPRRDSVVAVPPTVPFGPPRTDEQVFAGYADSQSCRRCHREIYDAWQSSNHALAERLPRPELDGAAFEPPRTFQHASQSTHVGSSEGRYVVTALGLARQQESLAVERVIGNDPLRQFLVKFPGGRYQTLEASFDPRNKQWFNVYGDEDRQPGEWGHWTGRGMNWNSMCAGCHNTRARKHYDLSSDTYHTTMAETSVGCGACHGPLKAHVEWQDQHATSGRKDPTIARHTPQQTLENCGYCHARRGELTGEFAPGDALLDHVRLTMVDDSEIYYPDGQVHEEAYEFSAFLGSRMHHRGVNCLDCHNPHSGKTVLPGNWLCLRCHGGPASVAPIIQPVAHSHHKVFGYDAQGAATQVDLGSYRPGEIEETGGECVNCHMPQTVYMQRHWRHDHGFTIPDPLLTKQLGVPNACNRCHRDKDADWALKYCEEWFGSKMDRATRRRAQSIGAARRGDAAARDGLVSLLSSEEIPYWRAVAAGLLEPWGTDPSVAAALSGKLSDSSPLVREACVRSLQSWAATDAPIVRDSLEPRLDDPLRTVRIAAAWALRSRIDPGTRAGQELRQFLDYNADQPVGQLLAGAYVLARDGPLPALPHYQKAVEWDPNSAPIRHDYAVLLAGLGRAAEAAEQLEAACRLDPTSAEYRYKLALAFNELGEIKKTINDLREAVRLDPQHARAWYNLGLALNEVGQPQAGLDALIRAEAAAPADPSIPYARATLLVGLGRAADARQAARRALEIDPGYAPAQALLGSLRD